MKHTNDIKHTPGPWTHQGALIHSIEMREDIASTNSITYPTTEKRQQANAQRIVDCVNACEGINPDAVRDLLAALTALHDAHFELHPDQYLGELGQTIRRIIDKATK